MPPSPVPDTSPDSREQAERQAARTEEFLKHMLVKHEYRLTPEQKRWAQRQQAHRESLGVEAVTCDLRLSVNHDCRDCVNLCDAYQINS